MRSCCPCFFLSREKEKKEEGLHSPKTAKRSGSSKKREEDKAEAVNGNVAESRTFNFRELATATKNFRQETLIGEGGFGRVYKGHLHSGQVVAVKKLDRNGLQGKEFLEEVTLLSRLQHQNLVNLIGYCADGEQRLLVYEYLPGGSLDEHLFDVKPEREPLDWFCRMKVASGAAQGLEYLHTKANPPVLYKDLKSSNILLDEEYNPKLSDVALSSRTMGTYGYSAPEHGRDRKHTVPSDVYSFGVVLLELITGRKAMDNAGPTHNQSLVTWAQPIFKDPRRFHELADPLLDSNFPERGLNQVVAIAAMCLQEESAARPMMTDIVNALSFLTTAPKQDNRPSSAPPNPTIQPQKSITSQKSSTQQAEVPSNNNGAAVPTSANEDSNSVSRSSSSSSSDRESNSSSDHDAKYDDDGKDIGTANDNNSATTNDYGKCSASLGLCGNTNSHSSSSNDSSRYSPSFRLKSDSFYDDNVRGSSASSDRRSVAGNSEVREEEDGKPDHNGIEGISIHLGSMSIGFHTGSANSGFRDAISEEGNEDDHDNDKDQNGDHHIGAKIDSSSSSSDDEEDEISSETSDNFGRRRGPEID